MFKGNTNSYINRHLFHRYYLLFGNICEINACLYKSLYYPYARRLHQKRANHHSTHEVKRSELSMIFPDFLDNAPIALACIYGYMKLLDLAMLFPDFNFRSTGAFFAFAFWAQVSFLYILLPGSPELDSRTRAHLALYAFKV